MSKGGSERGGKEGREGGREGGRKERSGRVECSVQLIFHMVNQEIFDIENWSYTNLCTKINTH